MEKILIGVIKSEQPMAVKSAVVAQISKAAYTNASKEVCINLLKGCLEFLFSSSRVKIVESNCENLVKSVLEKWIQQNLEISEEFVIEEILQRELIKMENDEEKIRHITMLKCCIEIIETCHKLSQFPLQALIKKYLLVSFSEVNTLELLSIFSEIYLQYPILIPVQVDLESKIEITKVVLNVVASSPFILSSTGSNTDQTNQPPSVTQLHKVYQLFSKYTDGDIRLMKHTSGYLFKLLSNEKQHPSILLASFLPCLKLDLLSGDIEELMITSISDSSLTVTLGHIVDWLCFPDQSLMVDKWILQFMQCLIKYRKFQILFTVIDSKVKQICNLLYFPLMRKSSVSVLTFMLISYLHSPAPFHQVSLILTQLMGYLKKTDNHETKQTCQVLVELIYTLMYHFPGYPNIYAPLIAAIEGYPKPLESNMKKWLEASFSIPKVELSHVIIQQHKSDTGKVGLENLGNTCYMNSVIQAIYNLNCIKNDVLNNSYTVNSQPISSNLQYIFALLHSSQRAAIAPKDFYKVSRPSWFLEGSQQDCSEYLKYLLDKIQQELTDEQETLNKLCTGEINTTVECLHCHSLSCRKETFNDLPLSFNVMTNDPSSSGTCTLKGGDSSERMERKMHVDVAATQGVEMDISDEINIPHDIAADISTSLEDKDISMISMLNDYCSPEELKDSNKYYCEKCSILQNAKKYIDIIEFPKYLILTLKRFTYNIETQKRSKILQTVQYQQLFNVCRACEGCDQEIVSATEGLQEKSLSDGHHSRNPFTTQPGCMSNVKYRLVSVIIHSGLSSDNGHYYCYTCKYSDDNTPSWCLMNDSNVTRAPVDFLSNLGHTFPRDTPYVCVYEKYGEQELCSEEIILQPILQDIVLADNQKYIQELKNQASRRQNAFKFPNPDKDNDKDNPGGGNGPCGGGLGGSGFSGGKYVF